MNKIKIARMAGVWYLILAVSGASTQFINDEFRVSGENLSISNHIIRSLWLFRISFMSSMIMSTSWILVAWMLYRLFKQVDRDLSVLMFSFVLVGSAITYISALINYAALLVINSGIENTELIVRLLQNLSLHSVKISFIFFGLWLIPLGLLIIKSKYFPKIMGKILGYLIIIAGLGYLIDFFTFYLFPHMSMISITPYTFWGELFLLLWLLIKGVKNSEPIIQN